MSDGWTNETSPHVVLVGAGHGHLHAIRHAADYTRRGVRLTLVAPEPFRYSGMASGVLAGLYPAGANEVAVSGWVLRAGGQVIAARAVALEPAHRTLRLDDGRALRYDTLSLNTGSEVAAPGGEAPDGAWPVKPVVGLTRLRGVLEARFAAEGATRVVVAGGGASGCEIAAAIVALARRRGGVADVTLLHDGARLLESAPPRAGAALQRALERRRVHVRLDAPVAGIDHDGVALASRGRIDGDVVVVATGLRAPALIAGSGLPVSADGALLVDDRLRSVADPRVFAVGDSAATDTPPLPRVGVFAIRQAPVLHHNLLAAATGGPPRRFTPQRAFLLILNLGDGTAFATRGGLHVQGRAAWWLKDWIDRRFLRTLTAPPAATTPPAAS